MTSTLLIFQIVLSLVITVAVLLQKSSSIGLGAYSGSNETMFGAKGPAGFLAKFTFSVALLFIINTLALGYFYNQENAKSVVDNIKTDVPSAPKSDTTPVNVPNAPTPVETTNEAPAAPVTTTETVVEENTTEISSDSTEANETAVVAKTAEEANTTVSESNTSSETNVSN